MVLTVLPILDCCNFPLTYHRRYKHFFLKFPDNDCSIHTCPILPLSVQYQSSFTVVTRIISLFHECWFTGMRSPKWPGGIFIFQFNGTIVVTLGRNTLPFRTEILKLAELRVAVMSCKIFTRGSLAAIVKGAIYICTTWLLDLLIPDLGKTASYMGRLFKAYPISYLFKALPSNVFSHREHCNQVFKVSFHFLPSLLF